MTSITRCVFVVLAVLPCQLASAGYPQMLLAHAWQTLATQSQAAQPSASAIDANHAEAAGIPDSKSGWQPRALTDFELKDQLGRTVTRDSLKGKPWAACFVFTHCVGPCPQVTSAMRQLYDRLKNVDAVLVTITVDPGRDTVDVMKQYSETYGADPDRWKFLTGDVNVIYGLIREGFGARVEEAQGAERQPGYEVIHTTNVMLVDAEGFVRRKFISVVPHEMAELRRELKKLAGRIDGSVAETPDVLSPEEQLSQAGAPIPTGLTITPLNDEAAPDAQPLPRWVKRLPATNAMLNGLCTILLLAGYYHIKTGQRELHKQMMLTAFLTSILFLACYLTYHYALHAYTGSSGKKYTGEGMLRPIYFTILISHVILATLVPFLAITTIYRGLRSDWTRHKRIARITFPIWLYVSVTGVVIYLMLYVA